jgi:hypothetical protein
MQTIAFSGFPCRLTPPSDGTQDFLEEWRRARAVAVAMATAAGFEVVRKVSKGLGYLVEFKDSDGRAVLARSLGVQVLSEIEFIELATSAIRRKAAR